MQEFSPMDWLFIAAANAAGKDKLTFRQRLAWMKKQWNNPGWFRYMDQAKDQAAYFTACQAIQDTMAGQPTGYLVGLDAGSSGCQIMSLLIRCEKSAKSCGLINSRGCTDLYTKFTKKMNQKLGVVLNITRQQVKEALMPAFYGSKASPSRLFGKGTKELETFYETAEELISGVLDLLDIIQNCWQPYAQYHEWIMPDGFTVIKPVIQKTKAKIEVDECDHLTFNYLYDVVKGQKQGLSLAADVVHSIDAFIMREMIRRCPFDIITIHDDYRCHANNVNYMRTVYNDILAEIHESNLIEDVLSQITGENIQIPKGKLFTERIQNSDYALR